MINNIFKNYKNNQELEVKLSELEEIWKDIERDYLEFLEKEIIQKKEELVYIVDIVDINKKKGDEVSSDLRNHAIEDLLNIQEKLVRAEKERSKGKRKSDAHQYFENEKKRTLENLGKIVSSEKLESLCKLKGESAKLKNIGSAEILTKISIIKSILDSESNFNSKEIGRLKKRINELEEKCQKIEEENLQREIERIENLISLGEKEDNEPTNKLLKELKNEFETLQAEKRRTKEKKMVEVTESFLKVKNSFIINRQKLVDGLLSCYNELSNFINVNYAKNAVTAKLINETGDAIDFSIKVNLVKVVGAITSAANDYQKINFCTKIGEEFRNYLESDKDNIFSLKEAYNSLDDIYKNKVMKTSLEIIDVLKLEVKSESGDIRVFKTFNIRYSEVCNIFDSWKKEYLNLEDMKEKISSLSADLNALKLELEKEEILLEEIKKKGQLQSQIAMLSK